MASVLGMERRATVHCIDDFSEVTIGVPWVRTVLDATIQEIRNRTEGRIAVSLIPKNSIDAARAYKGPKLCSVFIDGCHHYAECKADIEAWSAHVKRGGLVCGHDYWPKHEGVMEAVNETGPFEVATGTRIWFRRV